MWDHETPTCSQGTPGRWWEVRKVEGGGSRPPSNGVQVVEAPPRALQGVVRYLQGVPVSSNSMAS